MNSKLQRGLSQLTEAGHDKDKLGSALMMLHGALEDYFRSQLATEIAADEREQGRRRTDWQDLLNLWQKHRSLSRSDRELIYAKNGKRNAFAHGDPFEISRSEMEQYAQFVKNFMDLPMLSSDAAANWPQSFPPYATSVTQPVRKSDNKPKMSCLRRLVVAIVLFGLIIVVYGLMMISMAKGAITTDGRSLWEIFLKREEANDADLITPESSTEDESGEGSIFTPTLTQEKLRSANTIIQVLENSHVRSGPGTDFEIVGTAYDAEEYEIIETDEEGNWYKVRLENGEEGWLGSSRAAKISP
jgi:hypothetical protein